MECCPMRRIPGIVSGLQQAWFIASILMGMSTSARAQSIHAISPVLEGHSVGGVAIDAIGNLFVADFAESVFKVSPEGQLQPFAAGMYGTSGNAIDTDGNLLQSNYYGHSVVKLDRNGSVTATYTKGLKGPVGVAVAPHEDVAFIADCQSNTRSDESTSEL